MNEPIWHKPAWITAIVGMISAFLTIPGELSEYLVKRQEITAATLENQFNVVNQTLAQQGTERVFVLRYLSVTLDDAKSRRWAVEEVGRLDRVVELQKQVLETERRLSEEISKNEELNEGAVELAEELRSLTAELSRSEVAAGLVTQRVSTATVSFPKELGIAPDSISYFSPNAGSVNIKCSPEYAASLERVLVREATSQLTVLPAQYRTNEDGQVVEVEPARTVEIPIPAEYATITKNRLFFTTCRLSPVPSWDRGITLHGGAYNGVLQAATEDQRIISLNCVASTSESRSVCKLEPKPNN